MKIKDKKESWLEKADVYIYARFYPGSTSVLTKDGAIWGGGFKEAHSVWYPDRVGYANKRNQWQYKLDKFSSKDVKNIGKHLMYDENLPKESSARYLAYVIYEFDGWPAKKDKSLTFRSHTGEVYSVTYKSYNLSYFQSIIRANSQFKWAPDFTSVRPFGSNINNDAIEFSYSPAN